MRTACLATAATLAMLVAAVSTANADKLYVHAWRTALFARPELGSPAVAWVQRGQVLEPDDSPAVAGWAKVCGPGGCGWVMRLAVRSFAPVSGHPKQQAPSERADEEMVMRGRTRPSAVSVTAAARGLMQDYKGRRIPLHLAREQLARLEQWRVDVEQAAAFLGRQEQEGQP